MTHSVMKNCSNCLFSHGLKQTEGVALTCHRYPPTAILVSSQHPITHEIGHSLQSVSPAVLPESCCGEHQPSDNTGLVMG